MNILLTGATGYIGKRLLPVMLQMGHRVICTARNISRLNAPVFQHENVSLIEIDFSRPVSPDINLEKIDVAYYLIHSMSSGNEDFEKLERATAKNFKDFASATGIKQVIFLSGLSGSKHISKHLRSRQKVEEILKAGTYATTILRSGIIVGSGSASFEIIRDLVEKLPVMVTPKWLNTETQPIGIKDVIKHLSGVIMLEATFNKTFDIGGPEVLTYKKMLLEYAKVRGLKRHILILPVLTPKLSSYWLYFVTSINFSLAFNLVESLKSETICRNKDLEKLLGIQPITYTEAVKEALDHVQGNMIVSSWKDSFISSNVNNQLFENIKVPEHGCFIDKKRIKIGSYPEKVLENIWAIGDNRGWYYANHLWKLRGLLDKIVGGVGLRRGRTHPHKISNGDALDFWRVLLADKQSRRLLLFAEMKLPGEAWLEFKITHENNNYYLNQTATFRPRGVWGRMYWYLLHPLHGLIFKGMARNIVSYKQ